MAFTPNQALELLKKAHSSGRLPHALLLSGTKESGTHTLALRLAEYLDGAHAESIEQLMHPLVRILRPSSKIRTITIDAVRSVEPFLALRAQPGETKLVIMLDADRLTDDSANAFLKTLEEPPPQTLIILISEMPSRLLPTILSRCIRLDLPSMGAQLHLSEAQKRFLPAVKDAMVNLGSDVAALALRADFQSLMTQLREEITNRITSAVKAEAKIIAEGTDIRDWEARQKDATAAMIETEYLGMRVQVLELISLSLGQAVLLASHAPGVQPVIPELADVAKREGAVNLLRRMRAVEALKKTLNFNVQEALALDAGFIQIIGSPL